MTVETVTMYRVVCDTCGASPQDDAEFYAWSDESSAAEVAEDSDYLATDDGKHYCEDCTTWDEEGEERIPRPVSQPQPNTDKETMR